MAAAGISAICLAAFSLVVIREDGVPQRIDATIRQAVVANSAIKASWAYPEKCKENYRRKLGRQDSITYCLIGESRSSKVLFWGDSEVEQLFPLLSNLAENGSLSGRGIIAVTSGGCLPVLGLNRVDPGFDCNGFNRRVIERASQPDIVTVVLGSAVYGWSGMYRTDTGGTNFSNPDEFFDFFGRSLHSELKQLASLGKKIVILLPFPSYPVSIPEYLNKNIMFGQEPTLRLTRDNHLKHVAKFASIWQSAGAAANATFVDPSEGLCPSNECVYRRGLVSLYIDGAHFGGELAESIQSFLVKAILEGDQRPKASSESAGRESK